MAIFQNDEGRNSNVERMSNIKVRMTKPLFLHPS